MTSAVHPTDPRPVIALFCTRGMETFLSNAIVGILQVGIDAGQIVVGCPNNALGSVRSVTRLHSGQIQVIPTQKLSENEAEIERYSNFGSRSFTDVSWKKIFFARELIEHYPQVIIADVDISWIRNPLPYLAQVAEIYPIAVQTEALPRFPPALCCGFASFARCERAIAFLDALIAFHTSQVDDKNRLDDQVACQQLIERDLTWLRDIYCLPEALFLNGLGHRNLQNAASPCDMEGELLPFLFHANWTIGTENKRKLLASTGTWLLGDQTTITRGSSTAIASNVQASAEPPPVLAVIYPVFDVRGEIVERVRRWTKEQDFDKHGYRVLVVAGPETELDEPALRRILREQDALLRLPDVGCNADYWNAGAREANTPWLLFVEAHGFPERHSLSALAEWIAANPNDVACNFRIRNLEGGRIANLMKRWFVEIQGSWADPSTWRRFHRTAFAVRRDVFEQAGPFKPIYGQFAPPLLSARLHQLGLSISSIPISRINHELASNMSSHHDDTADYVRGEMDARAESDPEFFERYFGPSPLLGADLIPSRYARSMFRGLAVAALHRPRQAFDLLSQACALLPTALVNLRERAGLLAAITRVDEWLLMHSPLGEGMRWRRFLLAHRRRVRTEQMLWIARHPLPALQAGTAEQRWPITILGQHAIIGLHALEHLGQDAFRWTHPVFLLRLAPTANGVLSLETRNLRNPISLSDVVIFVGGRVVSSKDIDLDGIGNIKLHIHPPRAADGETDVVIIVKDLHEPSSVSGPGRRLGLPLFSLGFDCDNPNGSPARP